MADTVANRKKDWRVGSILRVSETRKEAAALKSYCKPWQGFGVPQPGELAAMPSKWGLLFWKALPLGLPYAPRIMRKRCYFAPHTCGSY